jgi:hypothetical protein
MKASLGAAIAVRLELSSAAIRWNRSRIFALRLRDARGDCQCGVEEADDPLIAVSNGTPACWKRYVDRYDGDPARLEESKWCPTCRRRQRIHEAFRAAMRTRGARMRAMQRCAFKAVVIANQLEADMADDDVKEPEPPAPSPQGDGDPGDRTPADEQPPKPTSDGD